MDSLARIELFTKYHIVSLRTTRQGYIREIKHVQFGWMKPQEYYRLQKLHDFLPMLEKVVEGGYRLKAALWNIDISVGVIGSGTEIPLGLAFVSGAVLLSIIDNAAGRPDLAALDVLSLILPFGEIYLLYRGIIVIPGVSELANVKPPTGEPGSAEYKQSALEALKTVAQAAMKGLGWFPF